MTASRIEIEHNGLLVEWRIPDPAVAEEIVALILARVHPAPPPRPRASRSHRKITKELLAAVAEAYQDAPPGGKNRAVRDVLGGQVSVHTATNYITRARQAGLIPTAVTFTATDRQLLDPLNAPLH